MSARTRLLLTFDAFGTLFRPRAPIGKLYADIARDHGLVGLNDRELGESFGRAFAKASRKYPNYGKEVGMLASAWWSISSRSARTVFHGHSNVTMAAKLIWSDFFEDGTIQSTFEPFVGADMLPKQLIPTLMNHFSTSAGYVIYPEVLGFFHSLRLHRGMAERHPESAVDAVVGIITNSDDRVPSILESFGLRVGPRRYCPTIQDEPFLNRGFNDIDFATMSYDVGYEKPDARIFDAAKMCAALPRDRNGDEQIHIHVGDDRLKDYQAAEDAGWRGVWLRRRSERPKPDEESLLVLKDLKDLGYYLDKNIFDLKLKGSEQQIPL